jgi:hypothetical protein
MASSVKNASNEQVPFYQPTVNADSEKWQKSGIYQLLRLASNRVFAVDDFAGKGDALATLQLAAEPTIGLAGAAGTMASGFAHLMFLQCVADTNDHRRFLLLRIIR